MRITIKIKKNLKYLISGLSLCTGAVFSAPASAQSGPSIDLPDDPNKDDPIARMNARSPSAMGRALLPTSTDVGSGRRAAIGGYGEADLLLGTDKSDRATADAQMRRFVLFLGNQFSVVQVETPAGAGRAA